MQTITAVIPAKDEEKNIARCLSSLLWCDKIIVICTGTDETAQIAKKLGAQVVEKIKSDQDDFEEVQRNLNEAIHACKTDWMLRVDADEVVTEELKEEIRSNVLTLKRLHVGTSVVAYGIPRQQYFLGAFLKGGDWAYDRLTRLFKPQFCKYDPIVKVHEQFKIEGKIDYLQASLLHYSHPDMQTLLQKFDSYTTLEAQQLQETQLTALLKLVLIPPYVFLRWMIYHHGYRDGIHGIQAGLMRAYYDVLLYSKFLRRKNQ